jgi:glycine cleavage system H protein
MTVIFVVATIIFFLGVDWLVRWTRRRNAPAPAAAVQSAPAMRPVRTPEGVFFARSHTWLNLFPSGRVRLGVDDFVGGLLDNPEVTLMRSPGERVDRGDPLVALSDGERRLIIRAPIAGEILAVNNALEKDSTLMREKLFSDGWAYTIRPNGVEELRAMLLGEESRHWIAEELRRFRDLLAGIGSTGAFAPVALQDGGAPAPGLLKHLDASAWKRFEAEFLSVE